MASSYSFAGQLDHKSGDNPYQALLKPAAYLTSLEPSVSDEFILERGIDLAKADEKPDVEACFNNLDSEEKAAAALRDEKTFATLKETPRYIVILMRMIKEGALIRKLLPELKKLLTINQFVNIARYQFVAAEIFIADNEIAFSPAQLAEMAKAHPVLLENPRILAIVQQLNLKDAAALIELLPQNILIDFINQWIDRNPQQLVKIMLHFVHHRAVAEHLLKQPKLQSNDLIVHIGLHFPDLAQPYLNQLNDAAHQELVGHFVLAKQLLDEEKSAKPLHIDTLCLIAKSHPLNLAFRVMTRNDFMAHVSAEQLIEIGKTHEYLAQFIIETKILRDKLDEKQLFKLARHNHSLKLKLLDYGCVASIPIVEMDWTIGDNLIKSTDIVWDEKETAELAKYYPQLALKYAQKLESKDPQKGRLIRFQIACYDYNCAYELYFKRSPSDPKEYITKILLAHPLIAVLCPFLPEIDVWRQAFEESTLKIAIAHSMFAMRILCNQSHAHYLKNLSDSAIEDICKAHSHVVREENFLKNHPLREVLKAKFHAVKQDEKVMPPANAKQSMVVVVPPLKTVEQLLLQCLDNFMNDLHLEMLDAPTNKMGIHFARAALYMQSDLFEKIKLNKGLCFGLILDFMRFLSKNNENHYKNYNSKFMRLKSYTPELFDEKNLLDRLHYLHSKQPDYRGNSYMCSTMWDGNESSFIAYIIHLIKPGVVQTMLGNAHAFSMGQCAVTDLYFLQDANYGIVTLNAADLFHLCKNQLNIYPQKELVLHSKTLSADSVSVPAALKKPAHLKGKRLKEMSVDCKEAKELHPVVQDLIAIRKARILELKASVELEKGNKGVALQHIQEAIRLRERLPLFFDKNRERLNRDLVFMHALSGYALSKSHAPVFFHAADELRYSGPDVRVKNRIFCQTM